MNFMDVIAEKWKQLCSKLGPALTATGRVIGKAGDYIALFWSYIMKFRKIFLAIAVAWAAVMLGSRNMAKLPATVGLDLQVDGSFSIEVARGIAVLGPVALTAVCIVLMFCSKRVLTPWVVSLITLIVPIFIWVINVFPT